MVETVNDLNKLIKGLKYSGTTITSLRALPVSEYNNETGKFEERKYTYDIDIMSDNPNMVSKVISDLERYTTYEFIISSVNNIGYG